MSIPCTLPTIGVIHDIIPSNTHAEGHVVHVMAPPPQKKVKSLVLLALAALLLAAAHVALNEKVGEEHEEAGDVGEVGRGEAGGKFAVRDGRGSFSVSE